MIISSFFIIWLLLSISMLTFLVSIIKVLTSIRSISASNDQIDSCFFEKVSEEGEHHKYVVVGIDLLDCDFLIGPFDLGIHGLLDWAWWGRCQRLEGVHWFARSPLRGMFLRLLLILAFLQLGDQLVEAWTGSQDLPFGVYDDVGWARIGDAFRDVIQPERDVLLSLAVTLQFLQAPDHREVMFQFLSEMMS